MTLSKKSSNKCLCDKNGNCKCDNQYSEVTNKNCDCDKNGNCKCNNQLSELSNKNCDCDKNGNCKCNNQFSELANKNCECDKQGNCKCGGQYTEVVPSTNKQIYPNFNQYKMRKRSAANQVKIKKRKTNSHLNSISNIEENDNDEELNNNNLVKRETQTHKSFENGEYYVDLRPDIYRLTPIDNSRNKRENFDTLVAIHGGGPVRNHLVAIRQRSMLPHSRFRRRIKTEDNNEPRQLIDMSEEELFGALPQSFEGELARYKRVKRGKRKT